jgi:hypothetical protein
MLVKLGLPPAIAFVILMVIIAYVVYSMVTEGRMEPLDSFALLVAALFAVRVGWRLLRPSARPSASDEASEDR